MNKYLVMIENGFALESLEELHQVINNYANISILPFPSVESAYREGCRRHVARKLTYPNWQMPALPQMEDMVKYGSIFQEPVMFPVVPGGYRYFCAICQNYAGIFTGADYVVDFFYHYPESCAWEVSTYPEALFFINRYYLQHIYPMSAYLRTDRVPYVSQMAINTIYNLPYLAWMKENCQIVGPFKSLPALEEN